MSDPITLSEPSLRQRIDAEARRLGFEAVAVARADLPLTDDYERYQAFIAGHKHGQMSWLAESGAARERLDTSCILQGAKSVVCLARRYGRPVEQEAADPPTAQLIARYARGRDYHNGMRKKLRKLAAFVRRLGDDVRARPLCDEEPILERAWAARAGLGFVGKNGLLILPGVGSYVLLGEIVTTLELEPDLPMHDRCGACTLCLDACPTDAFERPYVLDPRKCIAYLTIEHRGDIEPGLEAKLGPNLFGCDDCQTVCPYNRSRSRGAQSLLDHRFLPDDHWQSVAPADLLSLDEEAFETLCQGSPVLRATRDGLARNAAIVLGTGEYAEARKALSHAATAHESPVVRRAAARSLSRLGPSPGNH